MNFMAVWGAVLSTILAVAKLWEMWRDRFRLEVGYNFTSSADIGNQIFVRNLAAQPVIVCYWELLWVSGHWPVRKYSYVSSPEEDAHDFRIEPHSSMTLNFREQNHFDSGLAATNDRRLCLRVHLAGRRSVLCPVYG